MALAKVYVNYKQSILNPEAEAVHKALKRILSVPLAHLWTRFPIN